MSLQRESSDRKQHFLQLLALNLQLFKESFLLTMQSIRGNLLRTLLSLLGITVGIFTIVAVFIVIDSFKSDIMGNFSSVNRKTIFVSKWAWGGGENYEWWVYANFPEPDFDDFNALASHSHLFESVTMGINFRASIKTRNEYIQRSSISGIWPGHERMLRVKLEQGRMINEADNDRGANVCILGYDLAEQFFPSIEQAIGSTLRIGGYATQVIGVLQKDKSAFSMGDINSTVLIPLYYAKRFANLRRASSNIIIEPKEDVPSEQTLDEITRILRAHRRLHPNEINNFSLNRMDTIDEQMDKFFGTLNIAGLVIGLLSILVGGFGIANIMFVSVKERTKAIGIQKSLGAKNRFILSQFLLEGTFLSLLGGILGLLLIFLLSILLRNVLPFPLLFTLKHISIGLLLSAVIGILSGYLPAKHAASLDPILAINNMV